MAIDRDMLSQGDRFRPYGIRSRTALEFKRTAGQAGTLCPPRLAKGRAPAANCTPFISHITYGQTRCRQRDKRAENAARLLQEHWLLLRSRNFMCLEHPEHREVDARHRGGIDW